ncbi:glycosyltransferase [Massilia solisilvae]|uniref:Glycosyltransferase n=1 Tax=Massilia solisilvae TaxID=1811225 RepID=A0ABT2BNC7_9BURK|nr:glycosyltransferase [Massilia solisilvae]MCS0609996.1 glycosyltransferase [Massilia solisilvae]
MTKRALLIAFHFPPQAASSGIQRTLSFSRHLGKNGWEPLVLSAHPRAYPEQNPSQLASVPAGLVVKRAFALDTKRDLGVRGRYLGPLALPDRWVWWWFAAVPAGLAMIRRHRPQVIWSTFPIATAHLIGLSLHRLTGLPWIADFRDPMLQSAYPSYALQRKAYAWIERQTIRRCHKAVFTTHSAMASYKARFPELALDKCMVIENGYDEDNFTVAGTLQTEAPRPAGQVTLVHSGLLYDTGRDPGAFFEAIARLKRAGTVDAGKLRVILRAPGNEQAIAAAARRLGVDDIAEVVPAVPYREALQEMLAADGLLVFQGTPFNTQVPAKVYEYFRARRPILGLVDRTGETARVLGAAGFDSIATMDAPDEIAEVLERFLREVRDGSAHVASPDLVIRSSRAGRARQLAGLFDEAVGERVCMEAA